jgi:hydrogenase expression/formation protein HypD
VKYLDEFRDPAAAEQLAREIRRRVTRPWRIMEVCGGQTHAIVKFGIDELLPPEITLLHGPGCPVCVTPLEKINQALTLAHRPGIILCSFGDMLRVPGSDGDLLSAKAAGADVRIVYSPLDAVRLAAAHPQREVVFFGVGFETTAPATALAVLHAAAQGLQNFSLLISHVLVPPAMEALLATPNCRVQGFLAAGHVCTVMGFWEYPPIAAKYHVPIVVTGFEPVDILHGILLCVTQLEEGRAEVENQYARTVQRDGNRAAQDAILRAFQVTDRKWRGVGEIPRSGLGLRPEFAAFDAERKFGLSDQTVAEPAECRSGEVLQGFIKPHECPAFGTRCTPEHPLGATMVSSEGACAAYYRYRQRAPAERVGDGAIL